MAQHWIATRPGDLDVFVFEEYDVDPPQQGEVTIAVWAAGMNPADAKHVARGDGADFPKAIGYEVAGVVSAVGADTRIGSGPVAVGDVGSSIPRRGTCHGCSPIWVPARSSPSASAAAGPPR